MTDDGYCNVLTKGNPVLKEDACPLTVRERARLQGCPDDFIFITNLGDPARNSKLIMQTGKFMPVEFTSYLSAYVKWFLEGNCPEDFPRATGERHIAPNPTVDKAKQDWCSLWGYTRQEEVCRHCGSRKGCPII